MLEETNSIFDTSGDVDFFEMFLALEMLEDDSAESSEDSDDDFSQCEW